jgi:hypothetical protein
MRLADLFCEPFSLRLDLRVNCRAEDFPAKHPDENEQQNISAEGPEVVSICRPAWNNTKEKPKQHQDPE